MNLIVLGCFSSLQIIKRCFLVIILHKDILRYGLVSCSSTQIAFSTSGRFLFFVQENNENKVEWFLGAVERSVVSSY